MKPVSDYNVVSGFDDNYVLPFLVMVYSAKVNSTKPFNLTLGFEPSALSVPNRELASQVLTFLEIPFEFIELTLSKDMVSQFHISPTSYARLLLADSLIGVFLWLDCDLICLPGWQSIFLAGKNSSNGKLVSAVRDSLVAKRGIDNSQNESVQLMGFDYFNSGVALFDTEKWRLLDYPHRWPFVLKESVARGFEFADQCVLNFLCQSNVNYLPHEYNTLALTKEHSKRSSPFILHFAGGSKPWFYSKTDARIFNGTFFPRDVYQYLRYQYQLIGMVKSKSVACGFKLEQEQKRIRKQVELSGLLRGAKTRFFHIWRRLSPF
jgi:lipopolysaccharide biosynthesis glycosyltransferase